MSVRSPVVIFPGGVRIGYSRRALTKSSSLDATPVTGSLLFYAPVCCLDVCCTADFSLWVFFGGIDCIWLAGRGLFFRQVSVTLVMATDSDAAAGGGAGITFGVELVVPWDAPEAVVDLHSDGVMYLDTVPDVIGLSGRRKPQGVGFSRDEMCGVCVSLFWIHGGWSRISMTSPSLTWVTYLNRQFQCTSYLFSADNGRPRCSGIWYGCSKTWMRCVRRPINGSVMPGRGSVPTVTNGLNATCIVMWLRITWTWTSCGGAQCTVWKGTPQDCMDHVRGSHDVTWDVKSASLEKFVPPWTVQRQVWSDSLTANHSGKSTDVLLFSDIHLLLTHHYRVHKRRLPHIAFRKDYLTRLRV